MGLEVGHLEFQLEEVRIVGILGQLCLLKPIESHWL